MAEPAPAGASTADDDTLAGPLLTIEALAFDEYGPCDLSLVAGECVGVSGPSGSGKTRLLRCVADLDVHRGRLWLDGAACEEVPPPAWRRQVALLPAESAWWYDEVGAHFGHSPPSEQLAGLGFGEDVLGWRVDRLSSGEKQRLAVLRMLAVRPRILLLDEPTANLDEDNAGAVESLILGYLRGQRAAALWVSHDRRQLDRVAGRRCRMDRGRLAPEEAGA